MARAIPTSRKAFNTAAAWGVALLIAFPIIWTVLTSFKPEAQAVARPPIWFGFDWTLKNYYDVQRQRDYFDYFLNSVIIALGSTGLGMLIAIPAAWSMAFVPGAKTRDILMWMLSTKMMPAVGVLIPLYILCQFFGVLDSIVALIIIYALINLPIAVWMAYTYFCEVPGAILEAARIDGATIWGEMWHVLRPMTLPGLSSTGLLLIILSWNEAFWSLNLTSVRAAPLPVFIASYSSPEGLFWAKLSAASFLAVAPIMVLGWMTQKQLVRGLTFGAVK